VSYDFRLIPELAWVAVTAAIITIGAELTNFTSDGFLADPGAFLIALGLAAGRAAVAAVIARISGSFALR
jgi:hypothetical protein